eukprot:CAMPEP_0206261956 /NCGR_PEP_ID=MMETSP0047_2-20121206/27952_1 /ASSEMBLY_ACC=CAM_ASM_000192 /TAXON_ID=195065 /ORGANISM="Chroomonas mesostigmatica_cf, Strain CCMP1168" /LENGTH=71 /DNA_ID=CAMNT_0053689247 /DNA_START=15 /DNA_END=226 /DNA_ORIENTATION=-
MITAISALVVPDFGLVMAFIGSLPCNLMAFVLPTVFHMSLMWRTMGVWGKLGDVILLSLGISAIVICTWAS